MKQLLSILGSTVSIGVQTLDIVAENPSLFEVNSLVAHRNWELLARQAIEFDVDSVVIADESKYELLKEALAAYPIKVYTGSDAICGVVQSGEVDVVVNALVGYAGLHPTIAAIEAGKKIALANKETLVVGGALVMRMAAERGVPILPIDSEHSAIFQCLVGERSPLRRLIVTCSGGALRDVPMEQLKDVTPEQALKHPQWSMGAKITIDSATLVNKGFEVIDLGVDVAPETFVKTAVEQNCDVICCSALLTTTMTAMDDVVKAAEAAGIRDKVKIMVGGAPLTAAFAQKIGADAYTSDAATAAETAVKLIA